MFKKKKAEVENFEPSVVCSHHLLSYIHCSYQFLVIKGIIHSFPDSSVGIESACNAGGPSSIPGLGRSTGEGISYSLQYSWASLVAQLVKNNCNEGDLRWEDPPEKGKATHSNILIWRIPWTV